MRAGTRTIGVLVLAGTVAVFLATLVFIYGDNHSSIGAHDVAVSFAPLPDRHIIEGEALVGAVWQTLEQTDRGMKAGGPAQSLAMRIRDGRQHYYDIGIEKTVRISGLAPRTPVTVSAGDDMLYDAVPADWNGRIVFDTPDARAFAISFSQGGHDYHLGIAPMSGGAS